MNRLLIARRAVLGLAALTGIGAVLAGAGTGLQSALRTATVVLFVFWLVLLVRSFIPR